MRVFMRIVLAAVIAASWVQAEAKQAPVAAKQTPAVDDPVPFYAPGRLGTVDNYLRQRQNNEALLIGRASDWILNKQSQKEFGPMVYYNTKPGKEAGVVRVEGIGDAWPSGVAGHDIAIVGIPLASQRPNSFVNFTLSGARWEVLQKEYSVFQLHSRQPGYPGLQKAVVQALKQARVNPRNFYISSVTRNDSSLVINIKYKDDLRPENRHAKGNPTHKDRQLVYSIQEKRIAGSVLAQ